MNKDNQASRFYPIAEPDIGDLEVRLVTDAVRSGWVSSLGRYVDEFEQQFAVFCGTRHGVATCNGTAALHLALRCLGVGPGDEVIVPALTFVASANAVAYTGATPVFADVDPVTWCLAPESAKSAISPRTRAIIVVHLYGQPADLDPLLSYAAEHKIPVVEDAAEAHGALYKGRRVGGLGNVGVFSFYGNKLITTGEGGMVVTNDAELAERARFLRDHAMSATRRYWHPEIGYNYRITNLQAALGVAQLRRTEEFLAKKSTIMGWYREFLAKHEELLLNPSLPWSKASYWLICAIVAKEISTSGLMANLRAEGVDTRPFFSPMHLLPHYSHLPSLAGRTFPISEDLGARGVSLPSSTKLNRGDVRYIADAIARALRKYRVKPEHHTRGPVAASDD